jgi:hypothetical protein
MPQISSTRSRISGRRELLRPPGCWSRASSARVISFSFSRDILEYRPFRRSGSPGSRSHPSCDGVCRVTSRRRACCCLSTTSRIPSGFRSRCATRRDIRTLERVRTAAHVESISVYLARWSDITRSIRTLYDASDLDDSHPLTASAVEVELPKPTLVAVSTDALESAETGVELIPGKVSLDPSLAREISKLPRRDRTLAPELPRSPRRGSTREITNKNTREERPTKSQREERQEPAGGAAHQEPAGGASRQEPAERSPTPGAAGLPTGNQSRDAGIGDLFDTNPQDAGFPRLGRT